MRQQRDTAVPTPRLIGAKKAVAEYGIKYGTLRDLVHRGALPVIRIGESGSTRAAWYFDRSDIDAWITANKIRMT